MSLSYEQILNAALPGVESDLCDRSRITGVGVERPHKYWRSGDHDWAVFLVSGNRIGDTIVESVQRARVKGLVPLLVVRDNEHLAAVAARYATLQCHVACPIAGRGSLIPPVTLRTRRTAGAKRSTRIPHDLLAELAGNAVFPRPMRSALRALKEAYSTITPGGGSDEAEHSALLSFCDQVLRQMGFRSTGSKTLAMIRRLEVARWGGDRDHFFHSFQNFFFGLYAVVRLAPHFAVYRASAKLDWNLNSYHVWLLASLWHDTGYGLSHLEEIYDEVMGSGLAGDSAEGSRAEFLNSRVVQEALLKICVLTARLLYPEGAQTGYLVPDRWPKRNKVVKAIRKAFGENVMHNGHGAASALRLYSDLVPVARRLGPDKHDLLIQAVQLACASMPFHDFNFRDHLRGALGPFTLSTTVLPFAVLLAFVDSIQDDRRDLDGVKEEARFLERIVVRAPATITADVNEESLADQSILWKTVEARDVLSHLSQDPNSLYFEYPTWMVRP